MAQLTELLVTGASRLLNNLYVDSDLTVSGTFHGIVTDDNIDDYSISGRKINTNNFDDKQISGRAIDSDTLVDIPYKSVDENFSTELALDPTFLEQSGINELKKRSNKFDTLIFGSATGDSITSVFANSVISAIDEAVITNAMIKDISAAKITSGVIDTSQVTIKSGIENESMIITGSLQQFKDETGRTRIQIGKDGSGNFTFIVADEIGATIIDKDGIKSGAVPDGLIVNKMVSDNANISGNKLDIGSVFQAINDSNYTFKSSKIYFDDEGQSLDVIFTKQQQNIDALNNIASGNVEVYELDEIPTLTNYPSNTWSTLYPGDDLYPDDNLMPLETETEYIRHLGAIAYVEIDGETKSYQFTRTSDGYEWIETIGLNTITKEVTNLKVKLGEISSNVSKVETQVGENTKTIEAHSSSIQQNADAIKLKADASSVDGLSERVTAAEQKITPDAIIATVSDTYTTKEEFNNLEVGGRNLILASETLSSEEHTLRSAIFSFKGSYLTYKGERLTM